MEFVILYLCLELLFLQPCGVDGRITFALKKIMGSFYDNDEAPSIFDIAMAYENGNGGIIRPKVKKISDTYKSVSDTYKGLSDDEKKIYI